MNLYKDDLVSYFNFVLDDSGTSYSRTRYNLIDLLEQTGGLMQCITLMTIIVLSPFKFKRHELKVFCDYHQ